MAAPSLGTTRGAGLRAAAFRRTRFGQASARSRRTGRKTTIAAGSAINARLWRSIPSYRVGKRNGENTFALRNDRSKPLAMRMRLASDALAAYVDAVERAFGARRGLCQEVTFYAPEPAGSGRYSPPKLTERQRIVIAGNPD